MKCAILVLVIGLFTSGVWGQSEGTVDLRPRWEKGHTSRYHFWTTRETLNTMTAGGRTADTDSKVETEGEVTWRVEDARSDGSYTCMMTLDWMTADLSQNGEVKRNDSRKGSGELPAIHDLLNAMEGVPLRVEVASDGSIRKVDGVQTMRSKAQNPEIVPEELDFVESATDLATIAGAPVELRNGGTWRMAFRWTHDMGHLDQDVTYRLGGVEEIEGIGVATVTATGRSRLDVDRSQMPPPGSGASVDVRMVSSSYEGQVMFDLVRHEAVGRNSVDSRVIDVTIRLPNAPGPVQRRVTETIRSQTLRLSEE